MEAAIEDEGTMRERKCIVTGEVLPEARLVRFVAAPDARIVPDLEARLPGRGILADGLAKRRGNALDVENVVDDLKSEAELCGCVVDQRYIVITCASDDRAGNRGSTNHRTCLFRRD